MATANQQSEQRFTYADYLKWPEDERWELIEGRPYAMTPAPLADHQLISVALTGIFYNYFYGKTCKLYHAPFDVRLPEHNEKDEDIETVVQPDLVVVCDLGKLDKTGLRGAPDLVIEILSESTAARDLGEKLHLYEKHGVRCYIIADPWSRTLTVRYIGENGKYARPQIFAGDDRMPIEIFDGLEIDLARVFEK